MTGRRYAALVLGVTLLLAPVVAAQNPQITQWADEIIDRANAIKAANVALPPPPPPTAVDCQVSVWSAWGACQADGTQTRTRTITTAPANGGLACPLLTDSQACTYTPPPVGVPGVTGFSGALTNGSTVTLTGSNFGSKAAQQPWKWDDLNGVNGGRLEPRGWLVHTNNPQPLLSTVQKRPGHVTSAQLGQTGADVPGFTFGDNGAGYLTMTAASAGNLRTPPTNILIDYWQYFANGGSANNYKFWRWHTFNNPASDNKYWSMPGGNTSDESSTMTYFNAIGVATINGKWTHHRLYLHADSVQANVYFQHSIDQRVFMNTGSSGDYLPPDSGFTAGPWPRVNGGDRLSTFQFEMQNDTAGNGARNAKQYISDVAIDEGYGAVYLGSASTWAASTHTEYQPYTSWANGVITITLNKGSFTTGQAWVYVVNNARLVNASGFAVTLP